MKSNFRTFILFVLSSLICVLFLGSFNLYQAKSVSSGLLSDASYRDSEDLTLTDTRIANAAIRTSGLWVHSFSGSDVRHGPRGITNRNNLSPIPPIEEKKTILGSRQQLRIGGDRVSEATLGFLDINDTFLTDHLVAAGRSSVISHYYYSPSQCRTSGEFVIGWTESRPLDPDAPIGSLPGRQCPDIRHSPGLIGPGAQSRKTPENYVVSLNLKNDSRRSPQNIIDAAAPVHLNYYCSAVEDSGDGWGTAFSNRPMSPRSDESSVEVSIRNTINATCQKAIETCEESSDGSCSVVNEDPWRVDAANPQFQRVRLILQCRNNEYQQASGITSDEINAAYALLEEEADDNQDNACIFSIRYFYEVVISPLNNERTLIHTTLTDEGYAIHDLIGSVDITVSETPETTTTITLNAGDRFLYDYLLDSVQKQPKEAIPASERTAAGNHPLVKTFLDVKKWPTSFEPEIMAYQVALQEQFLPAVPPVSAELVTVNVRGVDYQVWKATVNLSDPNVAFSLVRDCSVNSAASFGRFAQEQKAALVMGGIFGGQNRCDPLNYPLYSEGRLQPGGSPQPWTQGTILGMRPAPAGGGIFADMQTFNAKGPYAWSSDQATWDGYVFAVTSGPRLLADGQVVYGEQAARDQGHGDPNVTNPASRTRRAALCLSRDKQQFHYVMSQQPSDLNLVELSEILQSSPVDCWDAVNLDGGAGPALAVQGDIKNPPGRSQPYLIVVYDAENAPSGTRAAWNLP